MIEIGDIVKSKAGHDEGRIYVVIGTACDDFVLCCDGRYRKLCKQKTKRVKHLIKLLHSQRMSGLIENGSITDADLVHEIRSI